MADGFGGKEKCGDQRLISLPLSRIRVIMKSSPEVSSINQEALVLTAKATVSRRREKGKRGGKGKGERGKEAVSGLPPFPPQRPRLAYCPRAHAPLGLARARARALTQPTLLAPGEACFKKKKKKKKKSKLI
uniref:Transcription factor CBF/NF-Y/archaeal histone domain-containing protein n=1 Tax=Sarcophilus harrisii TaxID=9305 RepID=A0A7N4NPT5_SARHA